MTVLDLYPNSGAALLQSVRNLSLALICCGLLGATLPAVAETPSGAAETTKSISQSAMVNVNTASAELMAESLNGIGMTRAEAIVAYREANGAFTSVEQLLEVKGVGEKVLEKNRHLITLK